MVSSPPTHAPHHPNGSTAPDGHRHDAGSTSSRTIGPRRSLPGPRAVLGGLLVTVAALGTFLAAGGGSGEDGDHWVVATRAVDQGERLTTGDLAVEPLTLSEGVADQAFATVDELLGAVTLAPLRPGGLVQASQVVVPERAGTAGAPPGGPDADGAAGADPALGHPGAAGPGATPAALAGHEVALRLPRAQVVDGAVNRGERVDVLATYGSGPDADTVVVVRDALVLRIGSEQQAGLGSDGGLTLTLQVPDTDTVLALVHAKDVATVTLVRATLADRDRQGAEPDRYRGPSSTPTVDDGIGDPLGASATGADGAGDLGGDS
jgi:hypothetical protein